MRRPRIAGVAEPLDQALLMQPAQMAQRRRRRHVRTDAHTLDRYFPAFAVRNK